MKRSRIDNVLARPWRRLVGRFALVAVMVVAGWIVVLLMQAWKPMGKMATGERLARMKQSPHWRDGKFVDLMPRVEPSITKILPRWLNSSNPYKKPASPPPILKRKRREFSAPPESGLRVTWLGHSSLLVEIDGKTLLIDPVWGEYVAPLELETSRRFAPPPLPFDELPPIDAVLISHDHYDHLDYPSVTMLADEDVSFYVPLGVGAHLEYWGVAPERIVELQWWDQRELSDLTLVCTPARHFSGRSLVDKDKTLWAGWAMIGPRHRAYYTGDTAMFPGFSEIGDRLGPFDVTMIESGAYNSMWADVHLGPEQAVQAHQMLSGKLMIPVHWGMFDLALHSWTEPAERVLIAARAEGVAVATPRLGESIEPGSYSPRGKWWPDVPFETAEEAPVVSSGL